MFVRRLIAVAAVAAGLLTVPAASSSAAPSGGCTYPPNKPVLSFTVSPDWISYGETSSLAGRFSQNNCGISGANIALEDKPLVHGQPAGHWTIFQWRTTDSSGLFSGSATPPHNVLLRAVSQGAPGYPTTFSQEIPLYVSIAVSMYGYRHRGCVLQFTGGTGPQERNRTIYVQNRGPEGHFNGWSTLWTDRTDNSGRYNTSHTLSCSSTYNISVVVAGDWLNQSGRSRTIFNIHPLH